MGLKRVKVRNGILSAIDMEKGQKNRSFFHVFDFEKVTFMFMRDLFKLLRFFLIKDDLDKMIWGVR